MTGKMLKRKYSIHYSSFFSAFVALVLVTSNATVTEKSDQDYYQTMLRFQQEISKFIGQSIISNHFSDCSVIAATTVETKQPMGENALSTFSSEITSSLLHLINNNRTTTISLISRLNENTKTESTLLRFTSTCKSLVSVLSKDLSAMLKFLKSISERITRKDEDHFIFITTSESTSAPFLNSHTASLVRFKVVIHPTKRNNQSQTNVKGLEEQSVSFSIRTSCIYCRNNDKIIPVLFPTAHVFNNGFLKHIFPDPTSNFHQNSIKISAPLKYTATYEMENLNGRYRNKRGIHTIVFSTVATKMNMSYVLQPCTKFGNIPEGASGVQLRNGTWAGCLGDVVRGISDMALSISPDDKRFLDVHFTSAMEYTYVSYITSKPGLFYSWKSVFNAFRATVWGLVIASLLLATTAIHLTDQYVEIRNDLPYKPVRLSRLFETRLYLMGYLVGQDAPLPRSRASKFVYMIWLLCGLVIETVYSCSLQALIVSPGLGFVPELFSQLVHSDTDYKWGAASGFRNGLGEQLFKNSDNSVMRAIYHKMEGDKDEIICTRKALLSNYACFNWEIMQRFHLKTEFADKNGNHPFQMAKSSAFFTTLNFITRKRELYRSHFNTFISRAFDSGLVKQMIATDWRKYRMGIVKGKSEGQFEHLSPPITPIGPKPFELANVKGCFIVISCGWITGVLSFSLERAVVKAGFKK